MKIEHKGKVHDAVRDPQTGRLMIGKLFAGFGEGNMNKGFKIVQEVHKDAPVDKD